VADRRVRLPKDKEQLIAKLTGGEGSTAAVFETRADLLTFAAVVGFNKGSQIPFEPSSLDPIRQEVFARSGHDTIINLLALATTRDPKCLAHNEAAEELRITTFEQYANGGLEFLRYELQGVDDPFDHLLLLIDHQRKSDQGNGEFDLTTFLP
jgi:dnd system-associated protein 4